MTLHPPVSGSDAAGRDSDRSLMAIAPERLVRRLEQVADKPIDALESIFDAVGEMLLGKAPRDGVTLFVTSDHLRQAPEATVATLRTLAEDMRIVAIVPAASGSGQNGPHALSPIVDLVLHEPVSDLELRRVIGAAGALPTEDVEPAAAPREAKKHAAHQAERPEPSSPKRTVSKPAPPARRAPRADEPIGDTDLIQEIMFGPDAFAPLALALIRQQTGWKNVQLVPNIERDDAVLVQFGGEQFGWLIAAEADEAQLDAWGAWLARWLALDRSYREYRLMTFRDDLTGAWNRRFFDSFLTQCIARANQRRRPITVMVFDLDHFKSFNDKFGHEAGDEILRETVRLLHSVIRKGDRVCRIGGDEFAVIFADLEGPREEGSQHPESVESIAHRFQDQICKLKFPKLGTGAPGTLSISAGLATYPWDGTSPRDLLRKADELALESKRRGKNVITFGPGAAEVCRMSQGPKPARE